MNKILKNDLENVMIEIKIIIEFLKQNNIKMSVLPSFKGSTSYQYFIHYFNEKRKGKYLMKYENALSFRNSLIYDLATIYNNIDIFFQTKNLNISTETKVTFNDYYGDINIASNNTCTDQNLITEYIHDDLKYNTHLIGVNAEWLQSCWVLFVKAYNNTSTQHTLYEWCSLWIGFIKEIKEKTK